MVQIDAVAKLAEIEQVLRTQNDPWGCSYALAILRRWQCDQMLSHATRQRAQALLQEFGKSYDRIAALIPPSLALR